MGADSVVICYGLRYVLGVDAEVTDRDIKSFEEGTDDRMVAARRVGLRSHFGRVTDGGEYFLLVGTLLGPYGVEGSERGHFPDPVMAETMARTKQLLKQAGLDGEPALHVQLEAQF